MRRSDKMITSALTPLDPFKVTRLVYIALLKAGREASAYPADRYYLQWVTPRSAR